MKIGIPDDYQDLLPTLECFRLLKDHEVIRQRGPAPDLATLAAQLAPAEAIVPIRERSRFTRELIERLPNLRFISQTGRSTHHIDVAACTERGIVISTGSHNSPVSPAELTWALILASRRHIPLEIERMRSGQLPCTLSHRLAGSTLGVWGLGAIGAHVARIGQGFGMNVLVWGRERSLVDARRAGYAVAASKADLFERSDVLSLHVRLTQETRAIVTADDLARMKPTALLVNTARAELIEPGALVEGLKRGRPGYAAVDVYEKEPVLNGDHPLLRLPNAVCTHHIAWAEHDNFELYFGESFENLLAWARGEPRNVINPEALKRAR